MLLTLRSLLWRDTGAITGTGDSVQAGQTSNASGQVPALGGGYWAHFGQRHWSAPRYTPAPSVPLPIPAFAPVALPIVISGYAETEQVVLASAASGQQAFNGILASVQKRQVSAARGLLAFGGIVASGQSQDINAEGEMIDVELELFAALALVA